MWTSLERPKVGHARMRALGPSGLSLHFQVGCGAREGEKSDFIPDKCFLPFRDHGLARVQPQTQCTITGPAREERSEGKKKEEKKHLEFKIQITVSSIKESGTGENTLKRQWDYRNTKWALKIPALPTTKTAKVWPSVLSDECTGPQQIFLEIQPPHPVAVISVMSACAGVAEWEWRPLGMPGSQLCKLWVTVVTSLHSFKSPGPKPTLKCSEPQMPSVYNCHPNVHSQF